MKISNLLGGCGVLSVIFALVTVWEVDQKELYEGVSLLDVSYIALLIGAGAIVIWVVVLLFKQRIPNTTFTSGTHIKWPVDDGDR